MTIDYTKHTLFTRTCKLCGAPLAIMANSATKKNIALDLSVRIFTPIWRVNTVKEIIQTELAYADHMDVCRKLEKPNDA